MWPTLVVIAAGLICQGLVLGEVDIPDFDQIFNGYELIFHDSHNLLLAVDDDNCYFVATSDNNEVDLVDSGEYYHTTRLQYTEDSLLGHIRQNNSGEVTSSSLDKVRNKYSDILADFHCIDKIIYHVNFFEKLHTGAGTDTEHHPKTHPGTGTGTQHNTCQNRKDDMYTYRSDCHKFIHCVSGRVFIEHCDEGTAFLDNGHPCLHESQVPACHH